MQTCVIFFQNDNKRQFLLRNFVQAGVCRSAKQMTFCFCCVMLACCAVFRSVALIWIQLSAADLNTMLIPAWADYIKQEEAVAKAHCCPLQLSCRNWTLFSLNWKPASAASELIKFCCHFINIHRLIASANFHLWIWLRLNYNLFPKQTAWLRCMRMSWTAMNWIQTTKS